MSTSDERPAPPAEQSAGNHFAFAPWPPGQLQPAGTAVIDPNNPPSFQHSGIRSLEFT